MRHFIYLFIALGIIFLSSCRKSTYLDAKPDSSLLVPESLEDLQLLLDNSAVFNGGVTGIINGISENATTDYYFADRFVRLLTPIDINIYTWNDDIYNGEFYDWTLPYRAVFYSNVVLDAIEKITPSNANTNAYNNVKGSALFFRAQMFYHLSQTFAVPYDKNTASTDRGIPLRLISDVSEVIKQTTVKDTYDQIIRDLITAKELLPEISNYKTRPTKPAALGLLARVKLAMYDYESALQYSNAYLDLRSELLDFNNYSVLPPYKDNVEVILHSTLITIGNGHYSTSITRIDTNLIKTYNTNDLRLSRYFRTTTNPVGFRYLSGYSGTNTPFGGIATDEVYLIRAECYARKGMLVEALKDLNFLAVKRWNKATPFKPIVANSPLDALNKVLEERRKELIFRGLRWGDLRRLNKEGANIVINRVFNGQMYSLSPGDQRYTYLIPPNVMTYHSDWKQNPR